MNKKTLINFIAICINFYLFPFLFKESSSEMMVLLVVMPSITILLGVLYTYSVQPHWSYPLIVGAAFLPTMMVYYNLSAWIFAIIHFLAFIVGCLIGIIIRNIAKSPKIKHLEN